MTFPIIYGFSVSTRSVTVVPLPLSYFVCPHVVLLTLPADDVSHVRHMQSEECRPALQVHRLGLQEHAQHQPGGDAAQ